MKRRRKKTRKMRDVDAGLLPKVKRYLTLVGLRPVKNPSHFGEQIRKTHGEAGDHAVAEMDRRATGSPSRKIYELKNASLSLALDMASLCNYNLYSSYMVWWAQESITPPQRLLDIGCDCGIVTCFYADQYPGAEVIGIDRNAMGLERARELSAQLGLDNVRFEQCDISEVGSRFQQDSFDIIASLAVVHEMHEFRAPGTAWVLEDLDFGAATGPLRGVFSDVRGLLRGETGKYVNCERLPFIWEWALMMRALNEAGMSISWDASYILNPPQAKQGHERFPVFVAEARPGPVAQPLDDLLAFDSYPTLGAKERELTLEGSAAEVLFRALGGKQRLMGVEIEDSEARTLQRIEVWRSGQLCILYCHSPQWERRISLHSSAAADELMAQVRKQVSEQGGGTKVRELGSTEELAL